MGNRADLYRHLTILGLCAPAALVVWLVFHAVSTSLNEAERTTGYVDSTLQMGILLGYVAMIGGVLAFGGIAAWSAVKAVQLWLHERKR